MITTHNLGFPRIGDQRQLKFATEQYWRNEINQDELQQIATELRQQHWNKQKSCDYQAVGDFSFYDQVLDTSFLLGHIPTRFKKTDGNDLDRYFSVARGKSAEQCCHNVHAGEMTKWFDTNYHYIVPELDSETTFKLNSAALIAQIKEAQALGHQVKPVIIGPVTYLYLAKSKDNSSKLAFLDALLPIYSQLLSELGEYVEWVQIDEPILVTECDQTWQHALNKSYYQLQNKGVKILLASYFGRLESNLQLACDLPVDGFHLDTINAKHEINQLIDWLPQHKIISLGIIDGRNIWKTDLNATLDWLEPIANRLQERLWLAPSCSLLHVPVDLTLEPDSKIKPWLAFATQKIIELELIGKALNQGRDSVQSALAQNKQDLLARQNSDEVHQAAVQTRLKSVYSAMAERQSNYSVRAEQQRQQFNLPLYPTTTIGSFPQTPEIRKNRKAYKEGRLSDADYQVAMQAEIKKAIEIQEQLELDVFVHGEAERNDMVEYFSAHLKGYASSQYGWVQSYGSRCVKPPIIYGDISRPEAMTVSWIKYAQSLTNKPMKGMLTGPVTMLNWSFVRDDQPLKTTCLQLALAIRDEVLDLEKAGIKMIQIDEAALREGLPLRHADWQAYLDWAIESFKICANGVADSTQIHTHMCYSEFNDIISAIADMDADVITIETSRSDMELLDIFNDFDYPNEIGPGVYDIHSPNIPSIEEMVALMKKAALRIPPQRLWVNPDCGLKTRQWDEVQQAIQNMVKASQQLREI